VIFFDDHDDVIRARQPGHGCLWRGVALRESEQGQEEWK
jgi:hypothetical protein